MSLHSAERSFWNCPELVEKLLPFLDPKSTARLARSHQKTLNILQGSFVWGKLIQRGCPKGAPVYPGVKCLMEILQMMEDPETVLRLQQNLLDLICERFPAPSCLHNDPMTCHCNERVILSCAKHSGGHVVTPPVFLLLEIIEAAFGTNYQKIEAISVKLVGDLELSALVARVPRQKKKKVTLFSAQIIELESNKSAEAFHTLVTASHSCVQYPPQGQVEGMLLWVDSSEEDFGGEGWETLAKTLQLHTPGMTKVVWTTKSTLDQGKKEDLRKLWDSIGSPEGVWVVKHRERRLTGEGAWVRL